MTLQKTLEFCLLYLWLWLILTNSSKSPPPLAILNKKLSRFMTQHNGLKIPNRNVNNETKRPWQNVNSLIFSYIFFLWAITIQYIHWLRISKLFVYFLARVNLPIVDIAAKIRKKVNNSFYFPFSFELFSTLAIRISKPMNLWIFCWLFLQGSTEPLLLTLLQYFRKNRRFNIFILSFLFIWAIQ